MKPELILKADMLDILFENRNKDYGAYELRRQYDKRLYKSLAIIFASLLFVLVASIIKNRFFPHKAEIYTYREIPITELSTIDDKQKEKIQPLRKIQRNVAQVIYSKPVITRAKVTNPPPEIKDLETKLISNKNMNGDLLKPGDVIAPADNSSVTGEKITDVKPETEVAVKIAEIMPEFPGGEAAFQRFLLRNIKPPENAEPGTKLRVLMRFVIDKNGNVTGIEAEQGGGNDFDKEVMRVLKKMPQWKPGMQNGKNVAVYFDLPVVLEVPDEN